MTIFTFPSVIFFFRVEEGSFHLKPFANNCDNIALGFKYFCSQQCKITTTSVMEKKKKTLIGKVILTSLRNLETEVGHFHLFFLLVQYQQKSHPPVLKKARCLCS